MPTTLGDVCATALDGLEGMDREHEPIAAEIVNAKIARETKRNLRAITSS
jgi:hypothetical protein